MRFSPTAAVRGAGFLAGAGVAVAVLIGAQPAPSYPHTPATIRVTVPVTGEFEAQPAAPAPALRSTSLEPGAARSTSTFALRNQTGRALTAGFRARGPSTALDGLVRIRLTARGAVVADTTLQGLRHGSLGAARIRSGATTHLRLASWIPSEISSGYEGQRARIELVPQSRGGG